MRGGIMYGNRMDRLGDTFFKFALHLRQRITEHHFVEALKQKYGFRLHDRLRIDSYTIHEGKEDHPITVRLQNLSNDRMLEIKTWVYTLDFLSGGADAFNRKYLIGADVRTLILVLV